MLKHSKQRNIVRTLLAWYKRSGRTFPWRDNTNPYHILLSEIMLQQTQTRRVLEKYPELLRQFPTLRSLAAAPLRDVVMAWRGMGYNNRAVRLHRLARNLVNLHDGKIPAEYDALIPLPGIGKYTANAILSSAFGMRRAIVDVNVRRVMSRIFWRMKSTSEMRADREIWQLAAEILPRKNIYDWNQALMDFGAIVCTSRKPACMLCPVSQLCLSKKFMGRTALQRRRPVKGVDGIPDRIYRGHVVRQLRMLNGNRSIRADALGKKVRAGFSRRHEKWFVALLRGLEKDGLIRIRGNGSLTSCRVSLA